MLLASTSQAFAETGATCIAADKDSQAKCIAMIGAVRTLMSDENSADPACQRVGRDDMAVTHGVIDWIKARPERQQSDLVGLIREALMEIDPCAQRSLVPETPPADPLDME